MGSESSSSTTASTSSPSGKRSRDPEDEVYLDNLHSHKRYLSEIMASSLNGLTVGDPPLPENLMEFPARDEMSMQQYSPMSEDSDESRFCDVSSQPDSLPTSPVSPYRYQRPLSGFCSTPSTSSYPSHGSSSVTVAATSQPRQRGGSDSEGRFPSSPSDICHSADLRRAALLRSVQMRTQPPGLLSSYELPFGSTQEPVSNIDVVEGRPCYMKSLADEREYQIDECSSSLRMSEPEFSQEKSCTVLKMNMKRGESRD